MGLKESITVQWSHFTRQFTMVSKFWLWIELEDLNCAPFDVFYHYNAKYLISKNIDFLVWAPSHASSQHHLSPKHKLFQFFFMIQLSVCPSINLSLLSWKFSYYLFEVLSAMIHSQSCFLSSLFKKINQNL